MIAFTEFTDTACGNAGIPPGASTRVASQEKGVMT
jgi:hypothetical protein